MPNCVLCGNKTKEFSTHRFPLEESRRNDWLAACNLKENDLKKNSCLCGSHFLPSDFKLQKVSGKLRLKPNCIPSLELEKRERITSKTSKKCLLCGTNSKEKLSYFRFPKNELERTTWKQTFNIEMSVEVSNAFLCSKHFIIKNGVRKGFHVSEQRRSVCENRYNESLGQSKIPYDGIHYPYGPKESTKT